MGWTDGLDCAKIFGKKLLEASEGGKPLCLRRRAFRQQDFLGNGQQSGQGQGIGQNETGRPQSHWQCISRLKNNRLKGLPAISEKSLIANIVFILNQKDLKYS